MQLKQLAHFNRKIMSSRHAVFYFLSGVCGFNESLLLVCIAQTFWKILGISFWTVNIPWAIAPLLFFLVRPLY